MKCCDINLGDLNTPIQIQTQTKSAALPGKTTPTHKIETVFTPLAKVKTLASTNMSAMQGRLGTVTPDGAMVTHRFTIVWVPEKFDSRHWVLDRKGNRYDIKQVENIDEADMFFVLHCGEVGDAANPAVR